jgi:HdeA/HdeB family
MRPRIFGRRRGAMNGGVGKMKSLTAMAVLVACLAAASSPLHAQIALDVSKMTCRDLLHDTIGAPEYMAYWFSGYYNGKRNSTTFDVDTLNDYADRVLDYCVNHQALPVMPVIEKLFNSDK